MRWPVALLLVAAACGDDAGPEPPTCAPGEIAARGMVGETLQIIKTSWAMTFPGA